LGGLGFGMQIFVQRHRHVDYTSAGVPQIVNPRDPAGIDALPAVVWRWFLAALVLEKYSLWRASLPAVPGFVSCRADKGCSRYRTMVTQFDKSFLERTVRKRRTP